MIDKIIKWIESNKWGKKVMVEITKRMWVEYYGEAKHGSTHYMAFEQWLDKEGK